MITQELLDWIKQQKQNGVSTEEIRQALLGSGWNNDQVSQALGQTSNVPMPAMASPEKVQECKRRNAKTMKTGFMWLFLPWAILIVTLLLWALVYLISPHAYSNGGYFPEKTLGMATASIANIILSLVGIVAFILTFVGVVVGIIKLSKIDYCTDLGITYDPNSGNGDSSIVPESIKHWNWGAAFLSWIWGAANRVWIAFLVFVPIINAGVWVYLGIKGNELAWRSRKWTSADDLMEYQNKWKPWGILVFVLGLLTFVGYMVFIVFFIASFTKIPDRYPSFNEQRTNINILDLPQAPTEGQQSELNKARVSGFLRIYRQDHNVYPSQLQEAIPADFLSSSPDAIKDVVDPKTNAMFQYQILSGGQDYSLCDSYGSCITSKDYQ
jgi:hypothetical protein